MNRRNLLLGMGAAAFLLPLFPHPANAAEIEIGWDAEPPLYEVSPGVRVVEGFNEEVFVNGGFYWVERGGVWYRSRDWHRGGWGVAEARFVPRWLMNHRRGAYLHWRHEEHVRVIRRR